LRRNFFVKQIIVGKSDGEIEVTRRRHKQLLQDLRERREYWKLITLCGGLCLEEAMDLRVRECGMNELIRVFFSKGDTDPMQESLQY
jgi:hypothetical protein